MPHIISKPPSFQTQKFHKRYEILDLCRGVALIGMISYHICFNLDSLFGISLPWFHNTAAAVWQFLNSSLFILLAGICTHFTKKPFKRGIRLGIIAILVTLITLIAMPQEQILFGVLHCLAVCLLLYALLQKYLHHIPAVFGTFYCIFLFFATFHVQHHYLFVEPFAIWLPYQWYHYNPLFFLGFHTTSFYSADYYPLFPYFFLFLAGHFIGYGLPQIPITLQNLSVKPLNSLGRHSLLIYLLHQPVVFGIMYLFFHS